MVTNTNSIVESIILFVTIISTLVIFFVKFNFHFMTIYRQYVKNILMEKWSLIKLVLVTKFVTIFNHFVSKMLSQ